MISFSIDKQRGLVNVEWMSRPVDSFKKSKNNQPLVLVLTSMEQSPTFASRLKRNFYLALFLGELTNASRHHCRNILLAAGLLVPLYEQQLLFS
jgi:hypothetical protein